MERLQVQFHIYLSLADYSGTGPGTILGHRDRQGNMMKYLTFEDCQFTKYCNPDNDEQSLVALEVEFKWTKNRKVEKKA